MAVAYATQGRQRVLCAVPTDVEAAKDYDATPQAAGSIDGAVVGRSYVLVADRTGHLERGVLTCEVSAPLDDKRYALSCRHVLALSRSPSPPGTPAVGAKVHERAGEGAPGELATLSVWRGRLLNSDKQSSRCCSG